MTYIGRYLDEVKHISDTVKMSDILKFIQHIGDLRKSQGRLFVLGVGGSAANASHAVNDFRKILGIETYTVTDNAAELTARINDEGWDTCFSKWLEVSRLGENDAILVFSVGGGSDHTSLNLVRAMELAKERDCKILSVVSRDGGKAKQLSDACVLIPTIVPERITAHAEEWQGIILHLIVNYPYGN